MESSVWIIAVHFTLLGYGGDVIPNERRLRVAFANEDVCIKALPRVRAALKRNPPPLAPDRITCEALDVVR